MIPMPCPRLVKELPDGTRMVLELRASTIPATDPLTNCLTRDEALELFGFDSEVRWQFGRHVYLYMICVGTEIQSEYISSPQNYNLDLMPAINAKPV